MCGIAGIINFDKKPIEPGLLLSMSRAIAHRGPDDEGYVLIDQGSSRQAHFAGESSVKDVRERLPLLIPQSPSSQFNIGLSHRRFAIIDLSSAGHQPIVDADEECCAVFNGEIYNYVELREELRSQGVRFRTQSDTEVLVEAYKAWGPTCFDKLNGFWALALYDAKRKTLLFSRDRIGKKPLYWTKVDGRVYFGSEIKSLLQVPEVYRSRRANQESVFHWIAYGVKDLDSQTCFDGIYSFPAASWAIVDETFPGRTKRFWSIPWERLNEKEISIQEASQQLRQLCGDAVRIRLRCDVPLSVELSGGLDSSAVLALASQYYPATITTYTIRFPDKEYNEEPYARSVARRFDVDYRVIDSPTDNFWSQILPFTWLHEEPYHLPNMHTHQVIWSKMRAAGTKVLLSGSGGDEDFAGYGIYFNCHQRDNLLSGRFDAYMANALLDSENRKTIALSGPLLDLVKEMVKRYAPASLIDKIRRENHSYYLGTRYSNPFYPMGASQALHRYMTSLLMPYWLSSGDKCVMGMPIEPRCPLLDYRVIDFAFRLPVTYLIRNGWRKWILRKSMEQLLPSDVLWRKRKLGFPFPYRRFQAESDKMMELILSRSNNPFLDLSQKEVIKGNWKLMSFILWYELFFNDNGELFLDLQKLAAEETRQVDYGFVPEYLRTSSYIGPHRAC